MMFKYTMLFFRRMMTPSFNVFILLVGVVGSLAFGISEIIPRLTFSPIFSLAFISLLLGWWLAHTRLKIWLAGLFVLIIGIVGMVTWAGNLLPPVVNITRVLVRWIWGYINEQRDIIENITPLQLASAELSFAVNTILIDLQDWSNSLFSENPVFQLTVIILVWGLAVWLVSAWAGWMQRRHNNVVLSIIPASVLLVATMGYTWANILPLISLLFCVLLLLALTWLNTNEKHWGTMGIDYPVDARVDTLIAAISISLVIVITAFFIPRMSIRKIVESIRELTSPQVQQAQPIMELLGIEVSKPSIGRFGTMLTAGLPRPFNWGRTRAFRTSRHDSSNYRWITPRPGS